MAQLVTGVVGGVIGFFAGGPYGAAMGFSVGLTIGSMFSSGTAVAGNTLGDIATQTSKEGVSRPIIWGRVRPIAGNLIACSEPKIVKTKSRSGGKGGGGGAKTTSKSVYRTYAIRVCEGPITKFVRVWRNNELVYDARTKTDAAATATQSNTPKLGDTLAQKLAFSYIEKTATNTKWGSENNAEFLKTARFYLGGWDQMPDAALEKIFGAGNVPPHRGTAYMVMNNELLDDTGGRVPQWIFEVERTEGYPLTSTPYAVEVVEGASSKSITSANAHLLPLSIPSILSIDFAASTGVSLLSAKMRNVLKQVTTNKNTSKSLGTTLIDAQLIPKGTYRDTSQNAASSGVSLVTASMQDKLITYGNEAVKSTKSNGVTLTSGSLTQ